MVTKKLMWILFGILVLSAWVLGSAIQAGAETMKAKITSYTIQGEVVPVGDMEGHLLIIGKRNGLVLFENGEVAKYNNWGTVDFKKVEGTVEGYTLWTFEDGSTILLKPVGSFQMTPKGLSVFKGTGKVLKGSGRFEGIKGDVSFSGREITPFSKETKSDQYVEVIVTYTLPSK
jgi:hypothetical protein